MTFFTRKTLRHIVAMSALTLVFAIATSSVAEEQEVIPVSPELTPKLRDLLRQEMVSIDAASKQILAALNAGDDEQVATLAQHIHDSFILEQSMTPEDTQDLMNAVPEGFLKQDQALHELAHALADAGREGDRAKQHELFSRMIESCTACHTQYATDRFPKLAE